MVGLGEQFDEMVETFGILREHGVQILTVGQYLRLTVNHLPVVRYWHPEEFQGTREGRPRDRLRISRCRSLGPQLVPRRRERARSRRRPSSGLIPVRDTLEARGRYRRRSA